jgi:hypothetical protein
VQPICQPPEQKNFSEPEIKAAQGPEAKTTTEKDQGAKKFFRIFEKNIPSAGAGLGADPGAGQAPIRAADQIMQLQNGIGKRKTKRSKKEKGKNKKKKTKK